jgi:hypothetical protein
VLAVSAAVAGLSFSLSSQERVSVVARTRLAVSEGNLVLVMCCLLWLSYLVRLILYATD